MMKEFKDNEIKLEDMTGLEFTQLMSEWKQSMFRSGMSKGINELEIVVLEKSIEPETSERNIKINILINRYLNNLRGVKNV